MRGENEKGGKPKESSDGQAAVTVGTASEATCTALSTGADDGLGVHEMSDVAKKENKERERHEVSRE